jgi:hypothetical protein
MKRAVPFLFLTVLVATAETGTCGIRFYGDVLLSRGVSVLAEKEGKHSVRDALAPFLSKNTVHVANLEGAAGPSASCAEGHSPCFGFDPGLIGLLDGFDGVSLQNNHSLDLGVKGLSRTIRILNDRNIHALGGRTFSYLAATRDGNIGVVAVTDIVNDPGDSRHVMPADAPEVFREIRRLKNRATFVVVYVHWGPELLTASTERMRLLAGKYVSAGADVVTGCHTHVVSGAASVGGRPVVWSLGNFLFDQKYDSTRKGAVLDCDVDGGGSLVCRLSGHERGKGTFLPRIVESDTYKDENAVLASCRPAVEKTWTGRFTRSKREEKLVLKKAALENGLSFLRLADPDTGKTTGRSTPMPITGVEPVDINGDGVLEIMLIQRIYSSFDHETAKRVYIYSFDRGFHALWRGTALVRPLIDAVWVRPANGRPVLAALHSDDSFLARKPETPGRRVMFYRWNGFGFTGFREISVEPGCEGLSFERGRLRLIRNGGVVSDVLL